MRASREVELVKEQWGSLKPTPPESQRPSVGCAWFFAVPMLVLALVTVYSTIADLRARNWTDARTGAFLTALYLALGFGLIASVRRRSKEMDTWVAKQVEHKNAPWMLHPEWAAGLVRDSGKAKMSKSLFFAVAICLAGASYFPDAFNPDVLEWGIFDVIPVALAVIGAVIVFRAIRELLRFLLFRTSRFELATLPGVVGQKLAGTVRTHRVMHVEGEYLVTLRCSRIITVPRTDSAETYRQTDVLWEERRPFNGERDPQANGGMMIRVEFEIPDDAEPTRSGDSLTTIKWQMVVDAEAGAVDYHATFEVPVFDTRQV